MGKGCCSTKSGDCCSGDGNKPTVVSTSLSLNDIVGACKVRAGIGRMDYKVNPGLYAVGKPDSDSPVLVSANYKLTFDTLRKNLSGLDCWLLILDTKGVNVWCAAGKGTFGTDELASRVEKVALSEVVAHRKLIVPQLGAPGVSAHKVAGRTGFSVVYGPVRAKDIKEFIASGNKATGDMRKVKFTFYDRLVLTPVELTAAAKKSLYVFGWLFLLNMVAKKPFGPRDLAAYAGAIVAGTVVTPVLLPFIPGTAFSLKGWQAGLVFTAAAMKGFDWFSPPNRLLGAGYMLLLPAISAYLAMNFTGCSTFTSPSGVLKEMKAALPLIVGAAAAGGAMVIGKHLIGQE